MPPVQHDLSHIIPPEEPPKSRMRTAGRRILWAAGISIVIHLVFVVTSALLSKQRDFERESQRPMRTQLVTRKPKPKDDMSPRQLVNVAKPSESKRPNKADYVAEHDSSVNEQTKSRKTSLQPPKLSSREQRKSSPPSSEPVKEQQRFSKTGIFAKPKVSSPSPNLFPTWKDQGMENASAFSERLEGVRDGEETRLNTIQWAHASFFNRVREAVARRWDPNRAIKRTDPKGTLVGMQDRITQVLARIDRAGRLVSISVKKESGVYFLDDEALKAFQQAAPFSNPPKELFASNDTFEFPFGFMLSYNRGFKFDLDWRN